MTLKNDQFFCYNRQVIDLVDNKKVWWTKVIDEQDNR